MTRDRLEASNSINAVIMIAGNSDQIALFDPALYAHILEPLSTSAHVPGLIREVAAGDQDTRLLPLEGFDETVRRTCLFALDVDVRNMGDSSGHISFYISIDSTSSIN